MFRAMLFAVAETVWTWPEVWGPFVVSGLALLGVVWSTVWTTGRNNKALIKAEDRRHEHALEYERRRRTVEARHDLYVRIEAGRRALYEAVFRFALYPDDKPDEDWWDRLPQHYKALHSAVNSFGILDQEASLFASKSVGLRCQTCWMYAVGVEHWVRTAGEDRGSASVESLKKEAGETLDRLEQLRDLLRQEVGSD